MNPHRIMEHARKLGWPAIGIELVIVIVGVFIGLQVSNWNVEREARQRGAMFAERLKADLREEAWYYQLQIEFSRVIQAQADLLTVYQGAARQTLVCSPVCQPMIMLGDEPGYTANAVTSKSVVQQAAQQ